MGTLSDSSSAGLPRPGSIMGHSRLRCTVARVLSLGARVPFSLSRESDGCPGPLGAERTGAFGAGASELEGEVLVVQPPLFGLARFIHE